MTDAIVASNADITNKNMVTIISLAVARRLGEAGQAFRRLTAGNVKTEFSVAFPSTYSGAGLTRDNMDTAKMTQSIMQNVHNVSVTITNIVVAAPTCTGACAPAPSPSTTQTSPVAGASNMRSGISAVLMLATLALALVK